MKAFDTVWRAGLWHKMLLNNINGKIYDVIFNMYYNIKSCIVFKNVTGLESISGDLENQLNINLKLFIILYADDTVILSES
jgi:hypothetical protein